MRILSARIGSFPDSDHSKAFMSYRVLEGIDLLNAFEILKLDVN